MLARAIIHAVLPVAGWQERFYRDCWITFPRVAALVLIIEVQRRRDWPQIFLTAMVLAHLRISGMGLLALSALHAAIDAIPFFVGTEGARFVGREQAVCFAALVILVMVTSPGEDDS